MVPGLYNGRNKTFFFASYEAYRNKTSAAPQTVTIPTAAMHAGDFSQWRDANGNLIPIYDPATTRVNPSRNRICPRSLSGKYHPVEPVQSDLARGVESGDDAARPSGRAQQFRVHAG